MQQIHRIHRKEPSRRFEKKGEKREERKTARKKEKGNAHIEWTNQDPVFPRFLLSRPFQYSRRHLANLSSPERTARRNRYRSALCSTGVKETAGSPLLCILVGPVPRSRVNSDRGAEQRPALFVFDAASALLISVNGAGHTGWVYTPYLAYDCQVRNAYLRRHPLPIDPWPKIDRRSACAALRGKQRFAKFLENLNWNSLLGRGTKGREGWKLSLASSYLGFA